MAMSSQAITAKLIIQNKIHVLELNIKDEQKYLQSLQEILQPLISAKKIFDNMERVVKENKDIEKKTPSLKQDQEWCKVVDVAKKNQSKAKQNYIRLLKESESILAKREIHERKLLEYEDEYKKTVLLLDRLSRSWPEQEVAPPVLAKKDEIALTQVVAGFNEESLSPNLLEEQADTTVYLKF